MKTNIFKNIRVLASMMVCLTVFGVGQMWGADEVYKTAKFGSSYNSEGVSSYTSSWSSTNDGFTVNVANGNNYNNGWDYIKFGRKNYTSVGTIITDAKIDKAVTKVVLTMSAITSSKVNSIKLYTSSNGSSWTEQGSYTTSSGAQTVNLASPTANLYYKIEFDCQSNSSNGFITVNQVDYYIASGPTTYAITYAVSPVGSGSITGGESPLASGATKSLTATPNSGYKFSSWSVSGTGSSLSSTSTNPTTLTVGTAATTVTANFAAVTYSNYRTLCTPPSDPSITVSPASITNLDYIVGQGPSAAKSFSMSGSNLESGTLTITAPTNFQVSKASGSGWASSITFTGVSGTLAATTVYVRLATGKSAGEYSGNVEITGCGLESAVNVALSGTVFKPTIIATPASVSWSTAVGVVPTTQSVTITGTHLKGAISATLNGTDAGSFSISTTSIAKATAEGAGGTITITYTGSTAATTTKTANIQLTASDATTVNVPITFNVIVDPNRYVLTPFGEIGPKDKVIIVGDNGTKYAMSNNNGTTNPPSPIDVTSYIIEAGAALSVESATAADMLWNIVKAGDGTFEIRKQSDNDVWLYFTSSNGNGVRVGTSAENDFSIISDGVADGYIYNAYREALLGIYNSQDWRRYSYTSGTSLAVPANISGQTFSFYVQKSTDPYVTLTSSFTEFTYEHNHGPSASQSFTVSGENLQGNIVVTPPTNYAISTDNSSFGTSPINLSPTNGTVASTTLYIRLVAGLAVGTYNVAQASGLSVTSSNADAVKAAVNGSVTDESFTVTATSSNVSHGTVSPASQSTTTSMTITATPADGYRVISGASGYTVTVGTATVVNNGDNTFTVTPSEDCTVRINFEAIPTHKVAYWASGVKIQESDVREGAAIPDQTTKTWVQLADYCATRTACVGWCTNPDYSHATDAPTGMITTMSPGGTMGASDVNYYAVFANTGGVGSTSFSRVTSLSQLEDGDVIIIVSGSANQLILQQTASGVQSGGTRTATTSFTDNTAANHWTLEKVDSNWKLCKDASNKLTSATTPAYTAYGNSWTIEDSQSDDFYFIRSGTYYLEYYSGWKTYQITGTPTSSQNATIRAAIYKQDPGYIDYVTNCACPGYSMHFGTRGDDPSWSDKDSYCFVESEDADGNSGVYWYLEDFELPTTPHYYVGWEGLWNTTDAKSADADFSGLCLGLVRDNQFSCGYKTLGTYSSGNNQGAVGTLRVRSSYTDDNKYIDFIPSGYVLRLSDNGGSTYASTALVPASANLTETVWTTNVMTVSAALASSGKYFVDLKTSSDHVWAPNMSEVANISSMGYKKDGGSSAGSWGTGLSAGMRGKFRIWADNCNKNWNCHFVPYYHLSYDGNGGGDAVTNLPEASADKSCEGDNSARTVQVSTTVPVRDGYTFIGWKDGGGTSYAANDPVVLSSDMVLYAQWTQNYSITYDRVGGTNVCADETCGAGMTYTVCGTEPTKSGYIFSGWLSNESTPQTYAAGATFTMPAANVTLTAQWTANWHDLTFTIHDSDDGTITGGPANNHVLDDHTFTFPNITGKSEDKWCWTFLGWTETAPVAAGVNAGRWTSAPEYTAYSVTSPKIYADKTYYAVYTKAGAGASGDVSLSNSTIVAKWTGAGNAYGTLTTLLEDAKTWNYTGYGQSGNTFLQLKDGESYYLQTPSVGGAITSITVNYAAVSSDSRTVYFNTSASKTSAVTHTFDGTYTSGNHDLVVDVSSLNATSIYILANNTFKINSVSFHFGPPAVYANTLDECPCVVEEFDLTYDANATTFPGSTTTCTGVTDYRWEDHDNEYTICSTEPTLEGYKFTHWATNANGSGTTYDAGEVITCVGETPITLYARYERVYTVTFNNQGVTTPVTQASEGATIAVPSATSPCSAEWAFVGWSETAIAPMSMLPTLEITAGTSTYTPTADKTLYAIYRKTSESSPFVAGMSGAYKITNGSTVYAGACNNSKLPETNAAGAAVFYIKYTSADGGKYTIQQSDGKYLKYAGSSTSLALDDETPYYWTMTKNGDLWHVLGVGSGRYLQYSSGTGFKAYNGSGYTDIAFVAADGQYYYRTMSCDTDYDITFHANGTTINWADGHPEAEYKDLADATVVSTFPTATFEGWTFLGWRRSDYAESTTAPASSGIFGGSDGTSGNALTISSANEDLYPVFTRFEDNEPFDQVNGGDYFIYFLESGSDDGYGGERRVYAASYVDHKRYHSSALCAEATEFTFTKLANGNWTIFDKTTSKYLYAEGDDWLKQKTGTSGAEWTLTVNGNAFDAYCVGTSYGQIAAYGDGTSATFENYARTNMGTNPSYHRVYLGGCSNRVFSTNPSNTPEIEIHGQVKVTSTATKSVKARSVLTVTASNISTANLTVTSDNSAFKFCLTSNGSYTASVNIPVVSNKVGVTPVYIEYTPAAGSTSDGIEGAIVTVSDGAVTPTSVSTAAGDVQGRHVPENFVIAAKWGDKWYALPANCTTSSSSTAGVIIEVDNVNDPTTATLAPSYTKYGLREVATSRYAANGSNITFTERISTETANNQKTLYNGTTTSIQVYAQWYEYHSTNPEKYEWIPSTDDFEDYTLTSSDGRTVSLNTSGVWGTLTSAKSYDGKVRLLPAIFYEEAPVQIVEWKQNKVIVMYTGSETSATAKVGTSSETSAQTLSDRKVTHGIYELNTGTDLTSNPGKNLLLTFGATKKVFNIPWIINTNKSTEAGHENQDVVILNGYKLTATSTKRSFRNVYVYGGGKLKIASGTSMGVNNIILRAGGISTNGSGGNATYQYIYPQVELGGTLTSTQANIKYEYITDYDHWYHLCLPFNASLNSITYPVEYYGRNVTEGNKGSWLIKRYDGAIRSTGEYNAWKDIEKDSPAKTEVTAGFGYIFWGAPKKVSVGGADAVRQAWGIQRMTMSVTADAATTAETNNKNISVDSYSEVATSTKPNDQGWNLVGNPYMVNLANWSSESMIQGQLVHTETDPWDGKWRNDGTAVRYVTIPDNHFGDYKAKTTATAIGLGDLMPGRAFFVQIAEGASTLTFATSNRASLMPALYAQTEQSVDVETGIVMSDETKQDEVNFWIKDGKTAEYEYNADYPKTPNNSHFNIYGVHSHGDLSWIAVSPEIAEGSMAIGYQVPKGGEYMLSMSETYVSDKIEQLLVTDHAMNPEVTVDLMDGSYEFTVNQAETNNERFTISIKLKEDNPGILTGVESLDLDSEKPQKFIYQDKMYILRGGVIYDATGKKVREINK